MPMLVCALDVSKGYVDVVLTDPSGTLVEATHLDDTPQGHHTLLAMVHAAHARFPEATLRCGAENTGGLERRWLHTLRSLIDQIPSMEVFALNPLAVKRMLDHQLHRAVTDAHSARGIAEYLRVIAAPAGSAQAQTNQGVRMLLGLLTAQVATEQELRTQFQSFLPLAFPELVRLCRSGIPTGVLRLVQKYPNPATLARARANTVATLLRISQEKAQQLITEAKESVTFIGNTAADTADAEDMALGMQLLTEKILAADAETRRLEQMLIERTRTNPAFPVLVSIRGVGEASAARLIAIIDDIARFPNSGKLVAYAGLDPVVRQSGDKNAPRQISRRGNARLRSILFNNVRTAINYPGPVKSFYDRLRAVGKPHMVAVVACMQKMLRIIYACWLTGTPYDPEYGHEANGREETKEGEKEATVPTRGENQVPYAKSDITAPVSGREAKRRLEKQKREEETLLQGSIIPCT